MLFKSSFISAIAALSLASGLASASPIVVRHENGTVEFQDEHLDANNELVARKIWLHKFSGCTDVQQHLIETAWRQMLDMAGKIKGKVNFDEKVAVDFLGSPKRNKDKQKDIRAMIESVATWQLGGRIDWHLVMTCDDPIRTRRLRFTEFPEGCPKGTPKEDYHKCMSRCWNSVKKSDGTLLSWKPAAAAYTESWRTTDVGQINFCPGFFNTRTCVDALHQWGNYRGEDKWNMVNYQCREQLLVHELFHIDANWQHHAPGVGRVIDRSFKIKDYNGNVVVRKAYGPLYTKILARWSKDVGHFVVTNADNLAFYFLGKWLSEHAGFYPPDPVPDTVPVSIDEKRKRGLYRREDVWDPIHVVDGQLQLGDKEDVAAALGAESPEEALEMYANDDNDELECTNFISEGEEDPEPDCGDDGNEPLELDISQDPPKELEEPDRPDSTDIPTVAAECIHTTMSFEGVTHEAYTLAPTVQELCVCGQGQAGATTKDGENGTRYIVCQTEGSPTVGTIEPPKPTAPPPPPPEAERPPPDMNSPACKACGSDLGASNCRTEDMDCLLGECGRNKNCVECNFDCKVLFN